MKATQVCSVPMCQSLVGPKGANGMCGKHNTRMHRHGDPHAVVRVLLRGSAEVRFWAKVDTSGGLFACWPWTASVFTDRLGYGKFQAGSSRDDTRVTYAHRFAWEQYHGPIPRGLFVCHHCDRPVCCNPAHLFLGTAADNHADMVSKGRDNSFGRGPRVVDGSGRRVS